MANTNAPNGFKFVRNYYSGAPTYQTSVRQIAYNNANSFGKGDVVKQLTTGVIDRALTNDTQVLGILDRIEYYDTAQQKKIYTNAWTAPSTALSGSVLAYVIDDPQAVFQAQGGPANIALTAVGANINFAGNAAPNAYGISVAYADSSSIDTTNTLPFRIVNVPQNLGGVPLTGGPIGIDSASAYNIIEVVLNSTDAKQLTGI